MTEDRSLDEFVPEDAPADAEAEPAPGENDERDRPPDESAEGGGEPIAPTTDFSPGGAACDACGAIVERRWRDGDGMVCPACKSW